MRPAIALGILTTVTALATDAGAVEVKRKSLIVMDLVAERGLDESLQRLLNELLLSEFTDANLMEVTGGSDLQAVVSVEEKKQLMGCDDATCIAEIGGALGADYMAVASIGRVGDFYLFNLKVIKAASAEVAGRVSKQVEGNENALVTAVRDGVKDIVRKMTPEAKAPLATEVKGALTPVESKPADPAEVPKPAVAVTPPTGPSTADAGEGPGVLPWVAAGVGVLAAGAGTAFGMMARSELKYSPVDPRYADARETADSRVLMANVSWGVAGAALVTAGVLFALDLMGGDSPDTTPAVSSEGAAVLIRF